MRKLFSVAIFAAVIFAAVIGVFSKAGNYGIVNCDDYDYMSHLDRKDASAWDVSEAIWMPLTWASYRVDEEIDRLIDSSIFRFGDLENRGGGYSARVYRVMHWHSILLHAVNAVLVFVWLAMLMGAARRGATSVRQQEGRRSVLL